MIEEAKRLATKGWKVFPIIPGKKTPLTKNGFKDATIDISKISMWWGKNPMANIGIATGEVSGITVIDVDPRHGGHLAIDEFDIPDTPYVKTANNGWHYYFKYCKDAGNGNNKIARGLDTKNDGGYVLAPPSILDNGGKYIWCDEDLSIAKPPEWVKLDLFDKDIKKFEMPDGAIKQGDQDDTLFRLACALRHKKFTPGLIRSAIKEIISDQSKCPQDPNNPFTDKDIERWINGAFKYPDNKDQKEALDPIIYLNPISCAEFRQKDLPPVEYYIDGILQKKGRLMVSAKANTGKSFLILNMFITMCKGEDTFLSQFDNDKSKPNALYFDLEMGESALQERLLNMGERTNINNLYVQSMYGWDMLNKQHQEALEDIIKSHGIEIVGFDPLGSLWSGDENKRENVKQVTDYFDYLLGKFGVSICLTHHWRKATQHQKEGGEMAAGSYGWTKWLDNHITINGEPNSMVVSCDKSRNRKKWDKFRVEFSEETMNFKYLGEFKNKPKFTEEELVGLFRSFRKDRVTMPELIKKGQVMCSKTTLYRLLDCSNGLTINKIKKPYLISEIKKDWEE